MSLSDVETALKKAIPNVDGIKTHFENVLAMDVNGRDAFLVVTFLPAMPDAVTLGIHGLDLVSGILQIDAHYPIYNGVKDLKELYERFREAFYAGKKYRFNEQEMTIRNCGRSGIRVEKTSAHMRVDISWYAYLKRCR